MPTTCPPGIRRSRSISNGLRKTDEDYWDRWRGAPKAFVPIDAAQRLWGTTHGNVSSIRVAVPQSASAAEFQRRLDDALRAQLDPGHAGFLVRDVRGEALAAAEGTTDFGEYFFYFSFFLVVSGLLLAAHVLRARNRAAIARDRSAGRRRLRTTGHDASARRRGGNSGAGGKRHRRRRCDWLRRADHARPAHVVE